MWCLALSALAAVPPLARPGEVPVQRWYAGIAEVEGRARGRWRRRSDGEFQVWELPGGDAVRWVRTRGGVVEDHLLDAAGRPSVTVTTERGVPKTAVAHAVSEVVVPLEGWAPRPVAEGVTLLLPVEGEARPGGGLAAEVLGGRLEVWREEAADPTTEAFLEGLLAGSGGELLDRGTTWIDGTPAVRFALQLGPDLALLWAWPQEGSTLALAWRVPAPEDPVRAMVTGRILPALLDRSPPPR